jgi:tRNA (guanine37-N1)-methyltransferase
MKYRIFTLHPDLFSSFISNSLIARGISKNIIGVDLVNWREKYGIGNYKQVDDKPFGGGSGMVLMAEPIYQALNEFSAISPLYKKLDDKKLDKLSITSASNQPTELINLLNSFPEKDGYAQNESNHRRILPNNAEFEKLVEESKQLGKNPIKSATISLTPRGFPMTQQVCEWVSKNFDTINILCGRYEGFDSRVSELVDLELSLGNFVLNGGEVAAMAFIEGVSRLIPDFITKNTSVLHDSFSSGLNQYTEQVDYIIGKKKATKNKIEKFMAPVFKKEKVFNTQHWIDNILPHLEHPQYTRPTIWQGISLPPVLLSGNHKNIQKWRTKWY